MNGPYAVLGTPAERYQAMGLTGHNGAIAWRIWMDVAQTMENIDDELRGKIGVLIQLRNLEAQQRNAKPVYAVVTSRSEGCATTPRTKT